MLAGSGAAVAVAVIVMLAIGACIGFINGVLISRFRMPAFMVTLVALMLFSSTAIWLTQSQNIVNLPPEFTRLGAGDIVSLLFRREGRGDDQATGHPALRHLPDADRARAGDRRACHPAAAPCFGRYIYAIGTNPRAAEISGVPVKRVIMLVFMFCGLLRRSRGDPLLGPPAGRPADDRRRRRCSSTSSAPPSSAAPALPAARARSAWTFIGVVFFVLLSNTLNYMGLSAFYIDVVKGGIILAAAALDVTRTRLLAREASG